MFRRLETFLEHVLEGPAGRMGASIQPVMIAKRLERAMDEHRTFSQDGVVVPNGYLVRLPPADYDRFASFRASLEDNLAHEVRNRARTRDYRLISRPWVTLQADDALPRGEFRVEATVTDAGPEPSDAPVAPAIGTAVYEQPSPAAAGKAVLLVSTGGGPATRFELSAPLITIGRGHDNDVILDDPQVSRRHCQLKLQQGMYAFADLDSSNGSAVNGRRVSEVALRPGDVITIGQTTIEFGIAA